jgi:hypothetical protein
MQFGNWILTAQSLQWKGDALQRFEIPLQDLLLVERNNLGFPLYSWILRATDEDWLSENDLYDLNYAFVYAAAQQHEPFNYEIFDATLAEQYEQFEEEENDDYELN